MEQETFQQGEKPESFIQSMEGPVREKFNALLNESRMVVQDLKVTNTIPSDIRVAVIAEPWSGDVLYNLPPLLAIADTLDWQVRIFRRDEHLDLMAAYKKEGIYLSIPVFVYYDEAFKEIAHWIERPQIATRTIDEESLNLRRRLREENKDAWRKALLVEQNELLGK